MMHIDRDFKTQEIINHFKETYLIDGLWRTKVDSVTGECIDFKPLIDDFGDASPFLIQYGEKELVKTHFKNSSKFLDNGLFKYKGEIMLFDNHDWLLGLIDAYRQTNDKEYLDTAIKAVDHLLSDFLKDNILLNKKISSKNLDSFLGKANPYNGGYVELFIELYEITGNTFYLKQSEKIITAWANTSYFRRIGLFSIISSLRYSLLNPFFKYRSNVASRLFKSNTNLVYSIISLYELTNSDEFKVILIKWLKGFEKYFYDNGSVYLIIPRFGKRKVKDLKAGFSALDILCDLYKANIEKDKTLSMATKIADYWIGLQWDNGLWPISAGKNENHIDANTDFAIALTKFYSIIKNTKYWEAYLRAKKGLFKYHYTQYGYVMSVNKKGDYINSEIKVKYQSLFLKLTLFPDTPIDVYEDELLEQLIRDR